MRVLVTGGAGQVGTDLIKALHREGAELAVFDLAPRPETAPADLRWYRGSVANARMRIGTTSFMVSEASERYPPSSAAFYIYVEDADAVCDEAVGAGATLIHTPQDMDYGDRQGGVTDPSGNTWWVSQRLQHEPYD